MEIWGFWISVAAFALGVISAWPSLVGGFKNINRAYARRIEKAESNREITLRIAKAEPCFLIAYLFFRFLLAAVLVWTAIQNFSFLFPFDVAWIKRASLLFGLILFVVAGRFIGDVLGVTYAIIRDRLITEKESADK